MTMKERFPLGDLLLVESNWDDTERIVQDVGEHVRAATLRQAAVELQGVISTLGDASFREVGQATLLELAAEWRALAQEE